MKSKLSKRKQLFFILIMVSFLLGIFEVGARIVFYINDDFNPYYIKFGFVANIEHHSSEAKGYSKFQPNTYKRQKVRGQIYAMKINFQGFRGLNDFAFPKPLNVFRIAMLGASSTFGYHVQDKETYPYQLEKMFYNSFPNRVIECLNLGIPHARIDNILALAKQELPALKPDIITFYAGYNNAMHPYKPSEASILYRVKDWFFYHSVGWRSIHSILKNYYYKFLKVYQKDVAGISHLDTPILLGIQQVDELRYNGTKKFVQTLESLTELADEIGCSLILITQNYNLYNFSKSGLNNIWRTYNEEVEFVEQLLSENKKITAIQATKLVHKDFMDVIRKISKEKRILHLVEGIPIIENDPLNMASYVHLTSIGNKLLANAIHDTIINADLIF